jgi:hypothetical protein
MKMSGMDPILVDRTVKMGGNPYLLRERSADTLRTVTWRTQNDAERAAGSAWAWLPAGLLIAYALVRMVI